MRSSRKEVDKLESLPVSGGISPVKRWNFTDCQVDRGEGGDYISPQSILPLKHKWLLS